MKRAYGLIDSPQEARRGLSVLWADLTTGEDIRDAFVEAVERAMEAAWLKVDWAVAMFENEEGGSQPAGRISSSQTPPYNPPPSRYDKTHIRVWQAFSPAVLRELSEEEFYFAFGQELSTIYQPRTSGRIPEGEPRLFLSKMRRLTRAAVALKLIEARLKASPVTEFVKRTAA